MEIYSNRIGIKLEVEGRNFPFEIAYHTYGKLNEDASNAKWVFHALTANSDAATWWSGLFGPDKILDPEKDFIICANMPGSCYGSVGPLSINPETGKKYYHDFPQLTLQDIVKCFNLLKSHLGIETINLGIGGSMGGSVLLEWNVLFPDDFKNSILIATSAYESSWGKAIHTVHKMAIETDPTWKNDQDDAGIHGLEAARGVGMLFYRTYESFNQAQIDNINSINNYKSDSYIRYQGKKLINRFNAFSYYFLLNSLDTHNIGRGRGSVINALTKIKSHSLIIGINSDILYPKEEQKFLGDHIPNSELEFIDSEYGHDGFLIETEKINALSKKFLNNR
ncbi:homoserine O-acetyltransferase family protein [Portibacter lacus]|uniref:Homoserine O-acetyltransferase n=1 Tax=Portibacter lacus TaxID=1099794 RepID=A0AA37WH49_9BACT|nr:homoserine O-acetyltransferase [Portibacter lacus]GLR18914.1 homoserine O-acetyltransferase [Portibacter lacus]